VLCGEMCNTTNTEAGNVFGKPATSVCRASTPPTEQPITTISRCAKRLPSFTSLWDARWQDGDVILIFICSGSRGVSKDDLLKVAPSKVRAKGNKKVQFDRRDSASQNVANGSYVQAHTIGLLRRRSARDTRNAAGPKRL
jgi:hypothetical protein